MVKDWKTINLSKNSKIKARIGWQGLTTAEYLDEGYAFLITGTDIKSGKVDWGNCHFVTYERYAQDHNIQISNGDLLLSKDGTIGKVALVSNLQKPATLNSGVFVIKPITDNYITDFMFYILESFIFKNFLKQLSAGSTINHLYQKDIVKFECVLPPVDEQKHIATALSDIDTLIVDLQKLIRKKKDVLYGSMQKLMTGEIRLQGFSEEWELVEIGSVAKVIDPHPSHRAPEAVEYGIPFVGIGDIDEEGNINKKSARIVDESVYAEHSQRYDLSKNLIGIGRVASLGKVIRLRNDIGEYAISPTMAVIDFESIDPMFAYYYMRSSEFQNQFTSSSNGSTRQSVGMHYIRNLNIRKPSPEEQVELSQCLGDMDYEIRKLEEKCSKYQKVKQGMMEELLTGKVRLV